MPRDQRNYITVHDGMPENPKIEGLSDAAFRLMVEAWCWCARNRTDGVIRQASWIKRGTPKARKELIDSGLVEAHPDGVAVHDYTDHQQTAAEIERKRELRRAAGSKGGKAKANAVANATASASTFAKQTASKNVAEVEVEEERTELLRSSGDTTAQTIVSEWIDRSPKRPPGQVVGQVAKLTGQMLAEGIDPDDIRRGLAVWMTKGLHPSTLPSVVNEVMNAPALRPPTRRGTDDKVRDGLALAQRLAAEEHQPRQIGA